MGGPGEELLYDAGSLPATPHEPGLEVAVLDGVVHQVQLRDRALVGGFQPGRGDALEGDGCGGAAREQEREEWQDTAGGSIHGAPIFA